MRREISTDCVRPDLAPVPEVKIGMFGFPVSLAWEILQSPFYRDTFAEPWSKLAYNRGASPDAEMKGIK